MNKGKRKQHNFILQDKKADLIINGNVEDIMTNVMKKLGLEIPHYTSDMDPTRNSDRTSIEMDWTIPTTRIKEMKLLYKKVCKPTKRKRKTFMYEREKVDCVKSTKTRKQSSPVQQPSNIEYKDEEIFNDKIQINDNIEDNQIIKKEQINIYPTDNLQTTDHNVCPLKQEVCDE